MKPTISNAFNDESADSAGKGQKPLSETNRAFPPAQDDASKHSRSRPNPRKSLAGSLAAMQADLRETDFGWSLDLSPIQAIDVLQAISGFESLFACNWLVNLEQSTWTDGDHEMPVSEIAQRLTIPILTRITIDQVVMDATSLQQLVSLCQPSRLVAIAIEGVIDERDAEAINKALETGRSPLLAELRAIAAIEVLGDRSVVLHCREKDLALRLVADNFRHYLGAIQNRAASTFEAPEGWQIERLLSGTGTLTIRPIETQVFSTSIDVGINTTKERFTQPANRSLIYDIPSNSWHDEP